MASEAANTANNAAWLQEVCAMQSGFCLFVCLFGKCGISAENRCVLQVADVLQMIADKNYALKLKEAEFTGAKDGAVRSIQELVQSAQTQLQQVSRPGEAVLVLVLRLIKWLTHCCDGDATQKYDARLNTLDVSIRAMTESINIVRERYSKQLESATSQIQALSAENERLKTQLKHATKKAKVLEWKLANRPSSTADGNAGDATHQQAQGTGDASPRDHPSIQLPQLATAHQAYKEVLTAFVAMRQHCYSLQISQDQVAMRQVKAVRGGLQAKFVRVSRSYSCCAFVCLS
jgi:hypothetical protein